MRRKRKLRAAVSSSMIFGATLALVPSCKSNHAALGSISAPAELADAAPHFASSPDGTTCASAGLLDAKLPGAVSDAIARDPVLRSQHIDVSVDHGHVTLTGSVRRLSDAWRAERLISGFKGAISVHDGILVKGPLRPDAEIAKELDDAIKSDPATLSAAVRATAAASTVTLRGKADSDAQRELLAEVASRVRGVRAVSLQVAVSRVSPRRDAEIASDLNEELADDARLDGTRVATDVRAKHAVLSGVVGSLAQRDAAVQDAWNAGIDDVDARALRVDCAENERALATAQRSPASDEEIARAVGRRISSDVRVGGQLPRVQVEQGVVTLSGPVVDFRAASAADRDARDVRGVWQVQDRTTVLPAKRESDVTIQNQVLSGIYDDLAVPDSRDVQVTTADARVTLRGSVASQEDKTAIEDDVREVPGVVAIEDDLRVRGYGPATVVASPDSIRRRVVEGIFWDPRVAPGTVVVDVTPDGDVTLSGLVGSQEQARAAYDDAIRAGASNVINHVQATQTAMTR